MNLRPRLLVGLVATLSVLACATDPYGHIFTALNESDRDVILEVVTDQPKVLLLAAHTRGVLSESWSGPLEGWRITVRDLNFAQLGSFPLENEPPDLTLHVTAGNIQLRHRSVFSLEGKRVKLVSPVPSATCG